MAIKVMLADDHSLIREGIKQLLEFDGSIEVVAQAADGLECLSVLSSVSPDVLLLDINMPNMNGLDVLSELKRKRSKMKILILTVHNEVEYLMKAMDMNVDGYILKDSGSAELREAIQKVYNGEQYIETSMIPALNSRVINRDIDKEKIESLTKREVEILKQIAGGRFNKEIADSLDITERTVKNHISNLFKKIDVNDRTQAAVFAIRNNLVTLY
ncbi:MAG: response regulator transcription factor [Lachnospiraceae bacterium]|nr:response regulator transcription factor [Lachnospiraceae bacterium]